MQGYGSIVDADTVSTTVPESKSKSYLRQSELTSSTPLLSISSHHIQNQEHGAITNGMGVTMRSGSELSRNNVRDVPTAKRKTKPSKTASFPSALSHSSTSSTSLSISTIANTTNAILGVSIFAMPWGFQQSGLMGGTIITIIVAFLSFETIRILLLVQTTLYQRTGDVKSYPDIAMSALGPLWSSIVQLATVVSCLGGCVGYLIFLGEITSQLFSISLEKSILAASFPLILLSWIRSFKELTLFTVVGCGAILLAIWAIILDGSDRLRSDHPIQNDLRLFAPSTSMNFLGPSTFTFTIHYVVLSMGAESVANKPATHSFASATPGYIDDSACVPSLKGDETCDSDVSLDVVETGGVSAIPESATVRNASLLGVSQTHTAHVLTKPLLMSYIISCIVVILFGIAGVIYFGDVDLVRDSQGEVAPGCEDHVCQNVILNLSAGRLKRLVGFSLIFAIVLSYVLILAPAREHIELALLRPFEGSSNTAKEIMKNMLRACLVLLTAFVAISSPYFGSMLGAVGGLTDALQSFVLPPIIFLRIFQGQVLPSQWLLYHLILLWGVGTILYTAFNSFWS